jgi:hypothetical protein
VRVRWIHRLLLLALVPAFVACAPFGPDFGQGGAPSSFSSIGTVVPPGPADAQAQGQLMNAVSTATILSVDGGGFANFTPAAASQFDSSQKLVVGRPARVGVVSIDLASADAVVLSTKSGSGRFFCVSLRASQAFMATPVGGTVDAFGATSVEDCSGRDWVLSP